MKEKHSSFALFVLILWLLPAFSTVPAEPPAPEGRAREILQSTGIQGGLIIHLGCGNGKLTAALRAGDAYLVHGLDADGANVEKARRHIESLGLYGPVSVERLRGNRLPYVDNLANLVVSEDLGKVSLDEVMRVLCPEGVAYVQRGSNWTKTVKPRPGEIDDWTHALYDAAGNAVARDSVVAPPRRIQWMGSPKNTRHHERLAGISAVVSAAGRLFYIVDEAPAASILLTPQWSLVARDAFNGILLWRRAIPSWEPHLRGFRSGPPELSRRLVAAGNRVYATLGYGAPVAAIDAATGKTVITYKETEETTEILYQEGNLFLVVEEGTGGKPVSPSEGAGHIVILNAETGRILWKTPKADPMPMTLAAASGRVCYLDPKGVVCLDAQTGRELWRTERAVTQKRPGWSAATLLIQGDVVLCADRQATPAPDIEESTGKKMARWLAEGGAPGDLTAYSAKNGKILWSCRCAEAYHAPIDVFVVDGLVWAGQSRARHGPDFTAARDLLTGEIRHRISPDKAFLTTMPHHRCHRNRATSRYIVAGRTGVEFIDLLTGEALRHHWIRGVCQYGTIPANGLLYVPPHSCACYIEAKLTGFLALAPKVNLEKRQDSEESRLETGAVSAQMGTPSPGQQSDWPTYRHDPARSGSTGTAVPANLSILWQAPVGGRLSSPVVAWGKVFVAAIDRHRIHALDGKTGRPLWRYAAGGRIDSPPTLADGLAVFGSADGWVYCLHAEDGELAWRFRAAPEDRRLVAFGQLESVWPVHGSVLVKDGIVYCAAGRSSYLDGGIHLCRLDLRTGRKLSEGCIDSRDLETGEQPEEPMMFEMPGALPDVLSADGELVYLRHLSLDPVSLQPRKPKPHLYSPAGFLNDDWWHRTYWIFGEHFYSGYIGWYFAGRELPSGRLLSIDDSSIYGFSYKPRFYRGSTGRKYHLFAADKKDQNSPGPPDYRRANRDYPPQGNAKFQVKYRWARDVPLLARAMVLAGKTIFAAGPPEEALRSPAAFSGKRGGILCAFSKEDGKILAEYRLDALPVFDGMAAAEGKLFVSMQDGNLFCLGDGASVPDSRPLSPLGSSQRPAAGAAKEPGLVGHWSFDEGAGSIARDGSGLGMDAEISGRWVRGEFGTCLFSNGAPAAVTILDGEHLHFGASSFSIEFWVKVNQFDCRILGKEDFPRNWWVINVLPDGRAEMVLGEGREKGKTVRPTSKAPLSKENWIHLAFVVDRERSEVNCYINGTLDSTASIPPTLTGSLSVPGKDLRIPSMHKPFTGLFDELKIYKRSRTGNEIQASYKREEKNRSSADFQPVN